MYCSLRCKRVVIAGASSDARLACAEERVEEGVSSKCRVEDSTFFRRGKSEIPESRIEIEESRRESELRREVTDARREARDCEVVILVDCVCSVVLRWDWGCEEIGRAHV